MNSLRVWSKISRENGERQRKAMATYWDHCFNWFSSLAIEKIHIRYNGGHDESFVDIVSISYLDKEEVAIEGEEQNKVLDLQMPWSEDIPLYRWEDPSGKNPGEMRECFRLKYNTFNFAVHRMVFCYLPKGFGNGPYDVWGNLTIDVRNKTIGETKRGTFRYFDFKDLTSKEEEV